MGLSYLHHKTATAPWCGTDTVMIMIAKQAPAYTSDTPNVRDRLYQNLLRHRGQPAISRDPASPVLRR